MSRLPHPRLDQLDKQLIKHFVQVDIRQQRRNHTSLRSAVFGPSELPIFQHTRFQPVVDHLSNHTIPHPLVQKVPLGLVDFLQNGKIKLTAPKTINEINNLISFMRKDRDIPYDELVSWNNRPDKIRGTDNYFVDNLE